MIFRSALSSFAILVLTGCCSAPPDVPVASAQQPADMVADSTRTSLRPVAFTGVSVVPMTGETILPNQTVVVRGERISEIGSADEIKPPAGALVVDGRGRYLLPGLAEMHGHIPPPNAPPEATETVLFLYLANGITTVRGMLGADGQLDLRERANSGRLLSPTLYLAGPSFSGNSIDSPQQAAQRVRDQAREGWDLLKIHPGLSREEYDAVARAAREEGIRFGGHVPEDVGLLHAIEMGQETFDHLDGYLEYAGEEDGTVDAARLSEAIEKTKRSGAWVVPTMALWETLLGIPELNTLQSFPELKYAPRAQVESWVNAHRQRLASPELNRPLMKRLAEARIDLLRRLNESGVRILMGTDAPQQFSLPGFSLHRELRKMSAAGMSPYEILVTGTSNVGLYFSNEDSFGTIGKGQRADLLLLSRNPLEDIGHVSSIEGVMVRGRWVDRKALDERLGEIAARYAEN